MAVFPLRDRAVVPLGRQGREDWRSASPLPRSAHLQGDGAPSRPAGNGGRAALGASTRVGAAQDMVAAGVELPATLTSAYDICPQSRSGKLASQAMLFVGDNRTSTLATCLKAAPSFPAQRESGEGHHRPAGRRHPGRMGRHLRGGRIDRCRTQPVRPAHVSERLYLRRHGGGPAVMETLSWR